MNDFSAPPGVTPSPAEHLDERLDERRIRDAMGPTVAGLAALEVVAETGSTNQDLLERPAEAIHRVARLAERQTAGRGRRGRAWFSPAARNVYLSLGWRFDSVPATPGHLPLVAAVAVARAVASTGFTGHGIKWPNDIVAPAGKLAGCLVEARRGAGGAFTAVLGVGLNVNLAGAEGLEALDQPWTDLRSQVPGVSRNVVAGALLAALLAALERFDSGGFAPFERDWRDLDRLAGREVTVRSDAGTATGRCLGLGPRGGLRVESADGERTEYLAGEATVRPTV